MSLTISARRSRTPLIVIAALLCLVGAALAQRGFGGVRDQRPIRFPLIIATTPATIDACWNSSSSSAARWR